MDVGAGGRRAIRRDQTRPEGGTGKSLNVLIVTGDGSLRTAARRVMEAKGHHVTCASHSGHALLACMAGSRIDVAFIETVLEDMPGEALAETLCRRLPALHVVFFGEAGTPSRAGVVRRPLATADVVAELDAITSQTAS
jgi:DNA-binding NtrC family response regulator